MTMLRIFFSIAFPASAATYVYLICSMTLEAVKTLDVRNLWSTDVLNEHFIEHIGILALALTVAICIGWFRLLESRLSRFENFIFELTLGLTLVGIGGYCFLMLFTFIALPIIALGTLTGIIIIVSFLIAGGTAMALVG